MAKNISDTGVNMNYIPSKKELLLNSNDNSLYYELYDDNEKLLLGQLNKLFMDWHKCFTDAQGNNGYLVRDFSANDMSFDGFYPGYLKQKNKLLFIGKEGRGLSGINYLDCLYEAIKKKHIGNKTLNQSEFHRRMIYLSYAIQNNQHNYSDIPYADVLSPDFGTEKISFSFMNLSKFSNESESFQADYELINKSVELSTSNRNFIQEEIDILSPNVIIAMNINNYFRYFGETKELVFIDNLNAVKVFDLKIKNKSFLLLDTYHFSAVMKENEYFFDPIIRAIEKFKYK